MHARFARDLALALSALAALTIMSSLSAPVRAASAGLQEATTLVTTTARAFTVEGNKGTVKDYNGLGKAPGGREFRAKPGETLFVRGVVTLPVVQGADLRMTELIVRFQTSPNGPSLRSVQLLNGSSLEFRSQTVLKGDYRQPRFKPESLANAWAFEPRRVSRQTVVRLEVTYPIGFDTVIDPGWFTVYGVDARFSVPQSTTLKPRPDVPARVTSTASPVIYAVTGNNDLLWYNHTGRVDGTFAWTSDAGRPVGTGWGFSRVFSGGEGVIYGINDAGDLMWYRHKGRDTGTVSWDEGRRVGTGWGFKHVFSGGNGVIYVVNTDGDLYWYRHDGYTDGTPRWAAPEGRKIGNGWNFAHLFAAEGGVIYAITDSGELFWYRHEGRADGTPRWTADAPRRIGNGWNFPHVFAAGGGVIYAVTATGDLLWYRHDGYADGSNTWAAQAGRRVGNGWAVKQIFSGSSIGG
jgi:hypothetical protein